ncbi:hypothetical protein DAPPUDRAFT_252642 [Daphnia pulex]|uniref:Uncharacterized protein n=1 Tax=Daphnia pulex TaxID=6669 RepID=E9H363_DAPPU|nr:hypothetical protein DAPPUDRAFT_252642 [Daphnia pulex]|eukprot:EFX73701.1 hypothetical protein DAPPUDRAFT_252642 [Daphnia pulex]
MHGRRLIDTIPLEVDNFFGTLLEMHPAIASHPISSSTIMADILAYIQMGYASDLSGDRHNPNYEDGGRCLVCTRLPPSAKTLSRNLHRDHPWEEEEDNGDNDYVQSLCLVDCPDSDLNETNRSEDMSFSKHPVINNQSFSEGDIESEYGDTVELEHPLVDNQSLSEGDVEDNIESEYNNTIELEEEMHDDQQDAAEADASFSEEELEDSLLTDGSSDFGDFFVHEHDISADVLMCSTPASDDGRTILHAAINDSICLAKGEKGEVSYVSSCYVYGSDDDEAYYQEGYFRYPTRRNDTMELFDSENSSSSFSAHYDFEPLKNHHVGFPRTPHGLRLVPHLATASYRHRHFTFPPPDVSPGHYSELECSPVYSPEVKNKRIYKEE